MRLLQAIAKSSGNKAEGINDTGKTLVVQERYAGINTRWYHIWLLAKDSTQEVECGVDELEEKLSDCAANPNENYWSPVNK